VTVALLAQVSPAFLDTSEYRDMTDDKNNGDSKPPAKKPRPLTTREKLRRAAICKKRYGRATLTIRRFGGITTLGGETDLEKSLNGFRAGEATAEEVAWAFVRARVQSHSPTFTWKHADLHRLIKLVTGCSKSPHFEAQTADELAAQLVKTQEEEREQLKRITAEFAESFAGLKKISKLFQPQISQWAAQQQKLFATLSRFVTPAWNKQLFATQSINEQMSSLGLTASVRKAMFPTLSPGITSGLAVSPLPTNALLMQQVRLPDSLYETVTKPLRQSLTPYRVPTPALDVLTRRETFTIGQALDAAREAAKLAEAEGALTQAQALTTLTAEVVEVVEAPSPEKLEQAVEHLSEQMTEIQEQQAANEEKRQGDRRNDQTLQLLLFFISIYLALFFYLLEGAPRNAP
jgi:hypothetical protein